MIPSAAFASALREREFRRFVGVPCSHLAGLLAELRELGLYVPAANEGAALAIAAGAQLAGERAAVLIQNSGLGNLVNPLTSLAQPFDIPVLVIATLRGWPDPGADEPQHAVMGACTHALLDDFGIAHWTLSGEPDELGTVLDEIDRECSKRRPAFILVPPGAVERPAPAPPPTCTWTRREALSALLPWLEGVLVFATTGYLSRELFAVCDQPTNFYMQGSMGHALALGLGAALARPDERVVVIDGDGALLMHMGTTSTVAAHTPLNLVHIVLDNGVYESTGGQPSTARTVDWQALATAVGYRGAHVCASLPGLRRAAASAFAAAGPTLLAIRVNAAPGAAPLRATSTIGPPDISARFTSALAARMETA